MKEQLILKVKSSESETHDVVKGFELYETSIGIFRETWLIGSIGSESFFIKFKSVLIVFVI